MEPREFDDPLDDILSAPVNPTPRPAPKVEVPQAEMHYESCYKCGGSGRVRWGKCFACQGKGGKSFKQPAAVRAHARDQAAARKENKFAAFAKTPVGAYLVERAPKWAFASELLEKVRKYGDLTDNQLNAVQRAMAKDAERNVARAEAKKPRELDVTGLDAAFRIVREKGAQVATLRTETITFSLAKPGSKNPGAIYAKDAASGTYLGKILDGKFSKAFECTPAQVDLVLDASRDPKGAALRYAEKTGCCSICGRLLTDPESVKAGIGPICANGWGW